MKEGRKAQTVEAMHAERGAFVKMQMHVGVRGGRAAGKKTCAHAKVHTWLTVRFILLNSLYSLYASSTNLWSRSFFHQRARTVWSRLKKFSGFVKNLK